MIVSEYADISFIFLLFILYAEMHYKFKFFPFSRYFKKEPEIIADIPHRLDPESSLPILLLIKDSDKYPINLLYVHIVVRDSGGNLQEFTITKNIEIKSVWWHEVHPLKIRNLSGNCTVTPTFFYEINRKKKSCISHNLKGLSESPLNIFISKHKLPGTDIGWHWGDIHYHSKFTEDFVEFGAPLKATQTAAKSMGLSFIGITDHSYDLDDLPDTWNSRDPDLKKWTSSRKLIEKLNSKSEIKLLPGEELSVDNSHGKCVHALIINHPDLLPGSGDGAEKWFHTKNEMSLPEISKIQYSNSLCIAAHPQAGFSLLERLLLKRGRWDETDFHLSNIDGFQILNGDYHSDFFDGMDLWIKTILSGKKRYIYAGNDAHGNFNRFRQIKYPMFRFWEKESQILGKCRTALFLPSSPTVNSIIKALKNGRCVISDGPLLELTIADNTSSVAEGDTVNDHNINIYTKSISTDEFGPPQSVTLFAGDITSQMEQKIAHIDFDEKMYAQKRIVRYNTEGKPRYIRGILTSTDSLGNNRFCYTNPVWINY